jgi:hypothetical protein
MPVITARQTSTDERIGPGGVITLLIAVVIVVLALWSGLFSPAKHVERLTIENPYDWTVTIEARRVGGEGWTSLGTVGPHVKREYREVLDVGRTWEVRFHVPGAFAVSLVVPRQQLEAAGWAITVPPSLASAARAAGLPPSPVEATGRSGGG